MYRPWGSRAPQPLTYVGMRVARQDYNTHYPRACWMAQSLAGAALVWWPLARELTLTPGPTHSTHSHSRAYSLHSLSLQNSLTPLTLTPNLAQSSRLNPPHSSPKRSKSVMSNGRNGRNGRQKIAEHIKINLVFSQNHDSRASPAAMHTTKQIGRRRPSRTV